MRKNCDLLFILFFCSLIVACSEVDYSDLETFINNSGNGLRGEVDPLPEVKQYQFFTYQAFDITSPFVPRKNEQVQNNKSGIQPDINRRKGFLESFPLESLVMVGSLEKDESIYALIKTPEGTLHRVKEGDYLGQDFGNINEITESRVEIVEIVQEGVNEWTERANTLMLED